MGADVIGEFVMDEARLLEKLRAIEALFAGATTDGERVAAAEARKRIQLRLKMPRGGGSADRVQVPGRRWLVREVVHGALPPVRHQTVPIPWAAADDAHGKGLEAVRERNPLAGV